WSKRQILEAYLNQSTFRGELQGIAAAAQGQFGKQPSGLDERESLLLAVLLRGPNASAEAAAGRACTLGRDMEAAAGCERPQRMARASLPRQPAIAPSVALAPHVARMLLGPADRRVVTTLDRELQAYAVDALRRQVA